MKYFTQGNLPEKNKTFRDKCDINKLNEGAKESLEGAIKKNGISEAISKIRSGKSPGLHGFPIEDFPP